MPQVFKRRGSPYFYARFQVDGKDYMQSTGTANHKEAAAVMRRMLAEKKGTLSTADMFDALIRTLDRQNREAVTPERQTELRALRFDMARKLMGAQAEKMPLSNAWNAWLDNPKKRTPGLGTVEGYRAQWERFCRWTEGRGVQFLHEVTPSIAKDYAADLWKSHVAPGTYNAHVTFLKGLFRVLKTKAGIVSNP